MSSLTTKKAIAYTFKDLLKEKSFSKITVNDIAKRCDINRQTFYYHFKDIRDLVEWICIEEVDRILDKKSEFETWEDKFLSVFHLMEDEKIFITNIYHSVSIEVLRKNISRLVYPIIYEEISNMAKNLNEDDKVFITNFYKYAFVSIVLNWIENNMNENPKDIVNKVSNLVTGTIKHACLAINSNI